MTDYNSTLTYNIVPGDDQQKFTVVTLHGDMDKAGLDLVKEKLEKMVDDFSLQYFVFDFSDLNFINSESIGFLMAIHSHLVKEKKSLVVVSAKDHVKDVLSVIGILSVIDYYDSLESFKKKLS
jgi:anti-anti-sigma factor